MAERRRTDRWQSLQQAIERCRRCPRLITYCGDVARQKRAAFRDEEYWGRPVPNLGSPPARLLIVGLAPGAHGANRTGRMFTGDRSGQWLYRALYRGGFANQPSWQSRHDGLCLIDCVITAAAHCAPPNNRPDREELSNCRSHLIETLRSVDPIVIVALGQIAWTETHRALVSAGLDAGGRPRFGHGAEWAWGSSRWMLGSYHPSQQNTFTGRLTEPMLDQIFARASQLMEQTPS